MSSVKTYVWDLEADGFLEYATKVHCMCILDYATNEMFFYEPHEISQALDKLNEADILICHHEIGYDLPLLAKLYDWRPRKGVRILDSLVWSKFNWPDRRLVEGCPTSYLDTSTGKNKLIGPHSLAHFGYILGNAKPEHSDWENYSPEMGHRNKEDVKINTLLVDFLLKENEITYDKITDLCYLPEFLGGKSKKKYKAFSPLYKCEIDPVPGLWLEIAFAQICQEQMERKCQLDITQLHSNMTYLRAECEKVEGELEADLGLFCKSLQPVIGYGTYEKDRIKKTANALGCEALMRLPEGHGVNQAISACEADMPYLGEKPKKKLESISAMLMKVRKYTGHRSWVEKPFKKNGDYYLHVEKFMGDCTAYVSGPFSKVEFLQIKLGQRQRICDVMLNRGWKPSSRTEITEKGGGGNPQLAIKGEPCPNLVQVRGGVGDSYIHWTKATKRMEMHTAFNDNRDENDCIPSLVDSVGTNTYRCKHRLIANLPRAGSTFFGTETRSVIGSREGYLMLGADESGLENRVAGHYTFPIDKGEYAKMVVEGDCHGNFREYLVAVMGKKCPEVFKDPKEGRNVSKSMAYAIMYGASGAKVGVVAGVSEKLGKTLLTLFWKSNTALAQLKEVCSDMHDDVGYIIGIDGRKVTTRSGHSVMNCLFQSAGSIIFKIATVVTKWKDPSLESLIVYHDELQTQVKKEEVEIHERLSEKELTELTRMGKIYSVPELAEEGYECKYHRHGEMFVKASKYAGRLLGTNVEFTAEYKIGSNWANTH
jgi:hypothetical protein